MSPWLSLVYGLLAGIGTLGALVALRPVDPDPTKDGARDGGLYIAALCVTAIVGLAS